MTGNGNFVFRIGALSLRFLFIHSEKKIEYFEIYDASGRM